MAPTKDVPTPEIAKVDAMVDERGSRIELPEASGLKVAASDEPTVGATGPTNWWMYGLGALAIVVAILFMLQIFGGAPGTDVQPGTPTAEPMLESPADP